MTNNFAKRPVDKAPVNFWKLPLAKEVRVRLASIDDSRRRYPNQKTKLAQRLLSCALDTKRALYVPFGSHPYLRSRMTEDFAAVSRTITADQGTPLCFFGNPLLLPQGWGSPSFDIDGVAKPILRATNAGFVVVTVEHDCTERSHFETICDWFNGHFSEVDHELRQHRDYDDYCVVLSGNRSLHFHFLFNTRHLLEAPHDQPGHERWSRYHVDSAVMSNAHQVYWKMVVEIMNGLLPVPLPADRSSSSYTQLKRTPWGIRRLDEDSEIFGLSAGTTVPQLVLEEKIRTSRPPKGSAKYIVPPDFTVSHYVNARNQHRCAAVAGPGVDHISAGSEMVDELAMMCQAAWKTPYPKPTSMEMKRGEWVIHFRNHPTDTNPSTVARGDYTTLLVQGQNAPVGSFTLPGEMTANEIGDHLARRFGIIPNLPSPSVQAPSASDLPYFERLKAQAGQSFKQMYENSAARSFPHISSCTIPELQGIYRQKLWRYLNNAMFFHGDMICTSGEGIGKTTALFDLMQHAALDTAMIHDDRKVRFFVFAFRSRAQAEEKALEYASDTRRAFVVKRFWDYYEEACAKCGVHSMQDDFEERGNILSVLRQMADSQSMVYDELERVRKALWLAGDGTSLFTGTTVLFTTHATATLWYRTHLNRVWHHPRFDPQMDPGKLDELRAELLFEKVVFDEPEWDEFAHILSEGMYKHLSVHSRWNWQTQTLRERKESFYRMKKDDLALSNIEFDDYSELRFLDLAHFERVQVDFASQPFGRENGVKAIYISQDGKPYYFCAKRRPTADSTSWIFLTTESFTTDAIAALYKLKLNRPLLRLSLDNLPGVYPVDVPVVKNKNASAQRIQKLATDILAGGNRNVVIADKLGDLKGERARTFQGMKGYNGWSDENVFVVLTYIHPEVYGRLNALSRWLELEETIGKYYAAQLSQAVGRNTGFRKKPGTKTVVVMSPGLLRLMQAKLARFAPRVRLQLGPDKHW
ncbi:hypothetical protein SAMN05216338_107921 [Bradyrhizobium sp. Rc2d]|uniref:hypothetical protein n=1 Tax=Bradyrhizobium sp. Rc2d TaxID=1855321 RepID=UPI00087E3332|nr:hypothetical protein [Bradyrhizobium sp. Rc2d]SDK00488.1 hypothetical protein SAMN05216338_107921 [Bradyrhizobium sp. Rc2d]